jgi:hypothetical protein
MTKKLSMIGVVRMLKLTAFLVLLVGVTSSSLSATTYTRNSTTAGTGDWDDATKWSPNTDYPNAGGDIIELSVPGGTRTIYLHGGAFTLGVLNDNSINNTAYWTISGSINGGAVSTGTLIFDNGSSAAEINLKTAGRLDLNNVDLHLKNDLIITNDGTRGRTLGDSTVSVSGTGDLILKNNATTTVGAPGGLNINMALNHTGWVINNGIATGTGGANAGVNITSAFGAGVTGIKQDSATSLLTIKGSSTFDNFTGQVIIQSGSLVMEKTSFGQASKIAVASGATLKTNTAINLTLDSATTLTGAGTIMLGSGVSTLYTSAGSHVAPGDSGVGTLIINGSMNIANGTIFDFDLGAVSDSLNISGALVLGSGLILNVNLLNDAAIGQYDLINFSSLSGASAGANVTSMFTINGLSGLVAGTDYTISIDSTGTKLQFDLNALPIPEPSTWVMLGLGIGLSIILRLRRKNSAV